MRVAIAMIALGAATLTAAAGLYAFGSASDMCSSKFEKTIVSPNGSARAVLFERDCGATTAETWHVSILPREKQFSGKPGNVFIAQGGGVIQLRWLGPRKLQISYKGSARVFEANKRVSGIEVVYLAD